MKGKKDVNHEPKYQYKSVKSPFIINQTQQVSVYTLFHTKERIQNWDICALPCFLKSNDSQLILLLYEKMRPINTYS